MKPLIKFSKVIVIFAGLVIGVWLLYSGARLFLPFDISQDYRKVQGAETIIFRQSWGLERQQCYKRCFWGLKKTKSPQVDDSEIYWESDASIYELSDCINTDHEMRQSIYSPDRKYILYCEIEYGYHKTGITDDEYCYYRVYEIETGKIITIYRAYKEWYDIAWLE